LEFESGDMTLKRRIPGTIVILALVGVAGMPAARVAAQDDIGRQPGERKVEPAKLPLDRPDVWTLNFRYKPPRILTVDGFDDKGNPAKQIAWYMWYQVYNRSGEPVTFVPEFVLVTTDLNNNGAYLDEPQPFIFEQIKKYEDRTITKERPNGVLNLLTTIEMSRKPIAASRPDAFPRLASGLAVWTDMAEKAPKTNKFSVYVVGLSNGVAVEQKLLPNDQLATITKKKTLRLDFIRPTDDVRQQISDIQPDESAGPAETWVYRTSSTKIGPAPPKQ
jgi:hypothetical protein